MRTDIPLLVVIAFTTSITLTGCGNSGGGGNQSTAITTSAPTLSLLTTSVFASEGILISNTSATETVKSTVQVDISGLTITKNVTVPPKGSMAIPMPGPFSTSTSATVSSSGSSLGKVTVLPDSANAVIIRGTSNGSSWNVSIDQGDTTTVKGDTTGTAVVPVQQGSTVRVMAP